MKELMMIQQGLKATKDKYNKFGGFYYRSCEGILEAVKPLLLEQGCLLTITDEVVLIGDRFYIKATATLTNIDGKSFSTTAYAREQEGKAGMDASQLTGSTSSYARKYALNGLFCIDDNKDADDMDNSSEPEPEPKKEWMTEKQYHSALVRIQQGQLDTLKKAQATMKMKIAYREGLEAAINEYKQQNNIQ